MDLKKTCTQWCQKTCTFRHRTVVTIQWYRRLCSEAQTLTIAGPNLYLSVPESYLKKTCTQWCQKICTFRHRTMAKRPMYLHLSVPDCHNHTMVVPTVLYAKLVPFGYRDLHSLITASSRHTSVTQGSQLVPLPTWPNTPSLCCWLGC